MMGLQSDWSNIKEIILYGFGRVGNAHFEKIANVVKIKFIIDNKVGIGEQYKGVPIYSMNSGLDKISNTKIVITASGRGYSSIRKSLEQYGYTENKDFINFELFLANFYWETSNKIGMSKLVFPVTNRCTLNCDKCNSFMPYRKKAFDREIGDLQEDIDLIFKFIDELSVFLIVGGEPLLYKFLNELILYVGENYKEKIGKILIITNGTIIPDDLLCKTILKNNVEIRISNYGLSVEYQDKLQKVKNKLISEGIRYTELVEMEWLDIGFPEEKLIMGTTQEELHRHMLQCDSYCHGIYNKKLYFCTEALMAELAELYKISEDDCIDLSNIKGTYEEKRKEILEYQFGKMNRGYFGFCKYCRGLGENNKCVIKAGIQK